MAKQDGLFCFVIFRRKVPGLRRKHFLPAGDGVNKSARRERLPKNLPAGNGNKTNCMPWSHAHIQVGQSQFESCPPRKVGEGFASACQDHEPSAWRFITRSSSRAQQEPSHWVCLLGRISSDRVSGRPYRYLHVM